MPINKKIFANNIIYLFKLNKNNNNQKKSNFIYETKIKRSTIDNWIKKNVISQESNLYRIRDYFNKWLKLNLTIDNLLYDNIKIMMEHHYSNLKKNKMIISEKTQQFGDNKLEKELLIQFRSLDIKKQNAIINLIKEIK